MNLDNVSREDWIVGGLAALLAIVLLFFPWYSISLGLLGSVDRSATSSPYAIWGLLALIASLAFIADLAVERLSPQTTLPAISDSRAETRLAIVGAITLFLVIKFVAHIGDFGWGFYFSVVVLIALIYFALQARAADTGVSARPMATPASAGTAPPPAAPPAGTAAGSSEPPPSSPPPSA